MERNCSAGGSLKLCLLANYSAVLGDMYPLVEVDRMYNRSGEGQQELSEPIDAPSGFTPSQQPPMVHAIQIIRLYYMPSLIAVGFVGNILAAVVFLATRLRKNAGNHYLAAVAVSDACFLISLMTLWLNTFGIDLYNRRGWCQLISFVNSSCTFLSLWLVVAFAVDRAIVHVMRARAVKLSTPLRAKVVILSIVIIAIVVYVNISLTVGIVKYGGLRRCAPLPRFMTHLRWLGLIDVIINLIIPYTAIVIIILLVLRTRCVSESNRSDVYIEAAQTENALRRRPARLSWICVIVLLVFIVLRMPSEIFRLLHTIRGLSNKFYPMSMHVYYWQQISQQVLYLNSGLKIFIYLLFYPSFRRSLAELRFSLKCRLRASRADDISPALDDGKTQRDVCSRA